MTATTMQRARQRRQVRNFVLVWGVLTFIVAVCTFIAIYFAYGAFNLGSGRQSAAMRNVAIPPSSASAGVIVETPTPFPTRQMTPEATPTTEQTAEDAAVAVAQAATTVPEPTISPIAVNRFELGVQVQIPPDLNPELMAQWANVAKNQLSVNWVKQQVRWELFEPEDDQYDWTQTDIYLPAAQAQGLNVLVSIVTAPDWAREPGVDLEQHGPPADFNDYVEFVVALLERYPGQIHAVEIWNEHNLDREWTSTGGLSAANYIEMLRLSYQAIKNVDPGIIVVSGALSPTGLSDGVRAWDDFVYMDQMIAAGLLNYTDCVGVHHNGINVSPDYRWDAVPNDPNAQFRGPFDNPHHSWSFRSTLEQYANKIALAGGDQPLCITEFGWASAEGIGEVRAGFEFAADNTLEEQRDFTVAALDNMVEWGFVRIAILWNLNYGPQAGWDPQNDNVFYSIIGPGFAFRPVFDAVRDWNREYEAGF
jgi:hypothetical protein